MLTNHGKKDSYMESSKEKALSLDKVHKRWIPLSYRCYLCFDWEESMNHFLLHRAKIWVLWSLSFTLFGISQVMLELIKELLLSLHKCPVKKRRKKAWLWTPLCVFWIVLKKINGITFDNIEFDVQRWKYSFVTYLWSC